MKVLISLIGEQPAPNLLPIRHYHPDCVMFVDTKQTRSVSERLRRLLPGNISIVDAQPFDPFDLLATAHRLRELIEAEKWSAGDVVFNLTGGTKPMALAAFGVAQQLGSRVLYIQSEGQQSRVYWYEFRGPDREINLAGVDDLPDTITLDDYLRLYLGEYDEGPTRDPFEEATANVLRDVVDEIKTSIRPRGTEALEVDFVVRCGNQVGVGEVKTKAKKTGIDMVSAVGEQRHFGTYVAKFLVSSQALDTNNLKLAEAYRVRPIVLASFDRTGEISPDDAGLLAKEVRAALVGPPPREHVTKSI